MHTGAMGATPIFEKKYESSLLPHTLHKCLLIKARANLGNKTSIMRQYLSQRKPLARFYSEDEMSGHLSEGSQFSSPTSDQPPPLVRRRTESLVKFADGFDTSGERFASAVKSTPRNKEIHIPNNPKSVVGGVSPLPMGSSIRPPRPSLTRKQSDEATPANRTSLFGRSPPSFAEQWLRAPSDQNLLPNELDDKPGKLEQEVVEALLSSDENDNVPVDNPYVFHGEPFTRTVSDQDDAYSRSTVSSGDRLQYDGATSELTDVERFIQEYGDLFEGEDENSNGSGRVAAHTGSPLAVHGDLPRGSDVDVERGGERTGLLDNRPENYDATRDNDEAGVR